MAGTFSNGYAMCMAVPDIWIYFLVFLLRCLGTPHATLLHLACT